MMVKFIVKDGPANTKEYRARYAPMYPWAAIYVDVVAHYGKKALIKYKVNNGYDEETKLVYRCNLEAV